jgi:acyl-CoA synthetase (AMP-forming)/AMP-acid ligase II
MTRSGFDAKQREVKYPKELVFHETLRRNVKRFPDRLAVVFEDNRYTYKEFNAKINRLANALIGLGVKKGEKVALFGHNSDVWLMASYAAPKAVPHFMAAIWVSVTWATWMRRGMSMWWTENPTWS